MDLNISNDLLSISLFVFYIFDVPNIFSIGYHYLVNYQFISGSSTYCDMTGSLNKKLPTVSLEVLSSVPLVR